jgi:hypothetical protein
VTCTFENRSEEGPTRGSITVIKTTNPATDLEFPFRISTGADSRLFVLRGVDDPTTSGAIENRVVFGELPEGEYVVQETGSSALPGGYAFYSVTCEGGASQYDGALAIIDLDPGDAIVCTFDNRRSTTPPTPFTPSSESGEIRIVKKAAGTERFSFEASWLPSGFTLADGETRSSGSLAPGVYWVNEAMSALQQSDGWRFARAACSDGSPINAIQLGGGEVVTCTFENAQVKAEVVVATTTSTTTAVVAEVVVETLPFTGTNAVGLSMIALFVMALGALVVLAATPIRQD